jgi:hypothetical protein
MDRIEFEPAPALRPALMCAGWTPAHYFWHELHAGLGLSLALGALRLSMTLGAGGADAQPPDQKLIQRVVRAHKWIADLRDEYQSIENLAKTAKLHPKIVRQELRLAFLPPDITSAIIGGSVASSLVADMDGWGGSVDQTGLRWNCLRTGNFTGKSASFGPGQGSYL